MKSPIRVLVAEDDLSGLELACFNLRKAGYEVDGAGDGREALDAFARAPHDVVVTDMKMPRLSGMELLRAVKERAPDTAVIVVTAYGSVDKAVEAMKAGADDFIGKPFNRDHLLIAVEKALERRRLQMEVRSLRIRASGVERPIVYVSQAMAHLLETCDRVAVSDASVLITGESGTGKELIARRIHVRSPRAEAPFVALNCAAMPAELLESEMFGHERGAFTGATRSRRGRFRQADGGTLFLDEIGDMDLGLQAKLLRVLQEGAVDVVGRDEPIRVDVRVLAATNQDLQALIQDGRFREDLFYRLNVVDLRVPPLRERVEDIPVLVRHFVEALTSGRDVGVPHSVLAQMQARPWPGNVRELENACERMVILCEGDELSAADLPLQPGSAEGAASSVAVGDRAAAEDASARASADSGGSAWPPLPPDGLSLVELERSVIHRVLEAKGWNVAEAARYLRVPRHILTYRMEKYSIRRP